MSFTTVATGGGGGQTGSLKKSLDMARKKRQEDYELSSDMQDELIEQDLDRRGIKGAARVVQKMKMRSAGFGEGRVQGGKIKLPVWRP